MALTILPFAAGSIPRVNDESLTTPDFAGDLLSYKRDAPMEMPSQNQDRPVNNMNMGDQNMMSKYSRPALTSWLKKRLLQAAFLTLIMASTTAAPVSVRPSSAKEQRSTDQLQQTLNNELPSSGSPDYKPEVSRQTVKVDDVVLVSPSTMQAYRITFGASPGINTQIFTLPFKADGVSVWMSEAAGGRSHIGLAVISTSSVQLSKDGYTVRVRYHSNWHSQLNAIAMVIAYSTSIPPKGFLKDSY